MSLISVRRAHLPRQTPDPSGDESPSSPQPTDSSTASEPTVQQPTESQTTTVQVSTQVDASSAMASSDSVPPLTVRQDSTTASSAGPNEPTGAVESTTPPTSNASTPSSEPPPTTSSSSPTTSVPPTDPPTSQPTLPPSSTPTSEPTTPPTSTPESTSSQPQPTTEPPSTSDPPPSTSSDLPQTSQPNDPTTTFSSAPTSSDNEFVPTSSMPESVFTTEIATTVDGQLTTITSTLPTSLWSPAPSSTRATPSLIAGVSVGAAVLALIIIGGIFAYRRNHRKRVIFGFVEKLVAKRKHQQNRARLLEGEDFGDEDVEDVAMTPYRDRDGAHSRLSSVTGGMPMEVHSRGMSASGALGDFGIIGGRDSPASTLSARGASSPSLFRARAESGSLFREEGVWPPPGEESRIVDPFARGMGAGESLLPSSTAYSGIPSPSTGPAHKPAATRSSSPGIAEVGVGAAAPSTSTAPPSPPVTKGPFAFIANLTRRTETPPPAYRSSPLSNADAESSMPLLTAAPVPALPPPSHSPSLSALIAATEIPMQTSILSSQSTLPTVTPVESDAPTVVGSSTSTGLPPGAAAPRAPGTMSASPPPEATSFNPDDMALPSSPSPTYLSSSPPSPQAPSRLNRLSNISSGSVNADGSPKNWLERAVHPRR
ncbi:hypothetical protein PLEOSDRAFT_1103927 [Pleurotus ostreatus PC15]|uniref:Uncharacterized protein n=1 Tax=Pleurotus ostreatus (strain PC15) TaxID=1137138 RepID=A0A067NUE3_PLEO1|nr:hypothetical protein PLEOSDRAFT_1103927 [Pleurotus ostreatus PC15]